VQRRRKVRLAVTPAPGLQSDEHSSLLGQRQTFRPGKLPPRQTSTALLRHRSALVQLWLHEHLRVYGDRLVEPADLHQLQARLHELLRGRFDWRQDFDELFALPAAFGGSCMIQAPWLFKL
jgi:hypothetical protein